MANRIFRGDAPPVAQVTKITPANVVAGDTFTITCNGKSVSYVAVASTASDVVNGLVAAVAASTIPEFTEVLASPSADGTYLTLTAVTAGVPFIVMTSSQVTTAGNVVVTETTPGKLPINEVHKIALVGTYTGGTFTLTWNFGAGNETTAAIAYNASAATVQTAIENLATPVPGDIAVTGGPGPNSPWFVTFKGALGGQAIATGTVNGTSLTGNGSVQITTTTDGNGLSDEIQMLDCSVHVYQGAYPFTLSLDGQTTSTINTNSTAAQIQSALQALPNIGSGNVLVYASPVQNFEPLNYVIHFTGALAGTNVSQLVVGNYINPGAPAQQPTMTTLQNGGQTSSDDFQWIDLGLSSANPGVTASFTVTYQGQTTPAVGNDASSGNNPAATLQTYLQALSTIGAGNCVVYGPAHTGSTSQVHDGFLIRLTGAKANTRGSDFTCAVSAGPGATVTRVSIGNANVNEVQTVTVFGTGGTFTLSLGAQTTSAVAWNASTGTLQTRIQTDLSATITACTVTGSGTLASPWIVTVTTPGNTNIAQMTGNGASLTGGGGTITELTHGAAGVNEVQLVSLIAGVTGGTFTLAFNGATSSPIAFNATSGTVQTALVALATINTVTVSGSAGGPYTVTWSGAQGNSPQPLLVGNGSLLTGAPGTQTLTATITTFSSGPNHYNAPVNWTGLRVPDSGDAVYFESGSTDCTFGLNQICTFTANAGTDICTFTSGADFLNDQIVNVTSTTTLPGGLSAGTSYYLINVDRNAGTCQLAASSGGTPIDITSAGSGVHTMGIRLASLESNSRYTGNIGLSQQNALGYFEYRPLYLHVGLQASGGKLVTIGTGSGSGSGKLQLDTDVDATVLKVIDTGGSTEAGVPALLWKGTNSTNTLNMINGDMGVALIPGETTNLAALTQRAGTIELGPGVTVTGAIDKTGGILIADSANINGGALLRS